MNVYQKILEVMKDVAYLQKDDVVGFGRSSYKAITEEKVTSTVRASLIKNGLVIVPVQQEHERTDTVVTDKNGEQKIARLSTVNVKYQIVNVDDPEDSIVVASSGTGVDTQDKGVGKAMTYAYKYMLLRTFAIPTGEDPDKTASAEIDERFKADPKITSREWKDLKTLAENHGVGVEYLLQTAGVETPQEIRRSKYAEIVKGFEQ